MTETVLVPLPDGSWLALDREQLDRARLRGAALMGRPATPAASQAVDETLLDADAAAKVLGVSVATVLRQARAGTLPCVRIGRYRKFKRSALLNGSAATDCVSARGS